MENTKKDKSALEQSLIEYKRLEELIKENTEETARTLIEKSVKKSLQNILSESEEETIEQVNEIENKEVEDDTELNSDLDVEETNDEEGVEDSEVGVEGLDTEDNEEKFDFDEFKTDEGEYDLTGSSIEDVIKIFNEIDPEDRIIVKKTDDGKIEFENEEDGETELVVDLEDLEGETEEGSEEGETEFEIEFDDEEDGSEDIIDDDSDETEFEIELDGEELTEKPMTQSMGMNRRAGQMSQTRVANAPGWVRKGTTLVTNEDKIKKEYEKKINEIRRAHKREMALISEDIQKYKETVELFSAKIKENAILNNNLAKYVKLVTENTTTHEEKMSILKRFTSEADSIEKGNKLYESIKTQLNENVTPKIVKIDEQVSIQGTKKINEQVMYEDDSLNKARDLMQRLSKF